MSLLFEVRCPVTHEVSLWPKRLARKVELTKELAEEFQISMEDIWTMATITADRGEEWFYDSLEWWDLFVAITNDQQCLKLAREGNPDYRLSIIDLTEIYWRCYHGLVLEWEHATPNKRKRIEGYLGEMEEARQKTIELAMPILAPEVREMLEKKKAN
jgi:hypothetical protein